MNLGTLIGLLLGTALIGTAAFLGASESNQPISNLAELNSFCTDQCKLLKTCSASGCGFNK